MSALAFLVWLDGIRLCRLMSNSMHGLMPTACGLFLVIFGILFVIRNVI